MLKNMENERISFDALIIRLGGGVLGDEKVDAQFKGSYRRGYHHAVAAMENLIYHNVLTVVISVNKVYS
jgi:hypothetical protein